MKRRSFLAMSLAVAVAPISGLAQGFVDFEPGVIETALADGQTVLVDYSAEWCSTCKRQERVINALRDENPAYDEAITFVKVDWDTYKDHEVTIFRGIPRRSTLILLRGEDELGRIVAGTATSQIQGLMELGL